MEDNEILKNQLKEQRYYECISLLKTKIISFIIDKIKLKDESIQFTTISDLISISDFYLGNSNIARSLDFAIKQEDEIEQIENLLLICKENNIR